MDFGGKRCHPGSSTIPELIRMSILVLLLRAFLVSAEATVTIGSSADLRTARGCLQSCFIQNSYSGLGYYLDCSQPYLESCYCREDLQSSAILFISSCISSKCSSNTVDVSSGVSFYTSYCSMTALPSSTPAKATSASARKTSTAGSGPANTGGANSSGSGGSGGSGVSGGSNGPGGDTSVNNNNNNINFGGAAGSFWQGSLYVTPTGLSYKV